MSKLNDDLNSKTQVRQQFTRKRGLLALLATLIVIGCVQNQPAIESGLVQLQTQFFSELQGQPDVQTRLSAELPEGPERETLVYIDSPVVPVVYATAETQPVVSMDDAADDPAIWIHPTDAARSLVLGTDKKAGIGVYDLSGRQVQFLPAGLPNNIDLRQNLSIGNWRGDLAISSDRADNAVTLFSVDESGVAIIGAFPVDIEPYGICLGIIDGPSPITVGFVTYKNGLIKAYRIDQVMPEVVATEVAARNLGTQLEGCVHDDAANRLFVGEEAAGIWQMGTAASGTLLQQQVLIDRVGEDTGLIADVEGVTLYRNGEQQYVVVSSQGNDSYAVYDALAPYAFRGRFRIGGGAVIDGSQETDGIAASGTPMGSVYPAGILVAQDGFNAPYGSPQNFKIVDWREIASKLELPD